MIQSGEAAKTVQAFFDAYLVRRDVERMLSYLTEDIQWVGIGRFEMVHGLAQTKRTMRTAFARMPGPFSIAYDEFEESIVSERCAAVFFTATVTLEADVKDIWLRAKVLCTEDRNGICRIASIHASIPGFQQDMGEFYPLFSLTRGELEHQLGTKALDIMGKRIPGGMMGGYLEPDFPLYYVNDRILTHLGYTYEEFLAAIDGKVINCMHPEDREQVDTMVAEAFRRGSEYEVQYRMRKKDGSYIWVNDIGKKGLSLDGRELCISVIRDISEEVKTRERLEAQAAEQKRLAHQYNFLVQSVLCGIIQFRLNGTKLVFKNANREAIRIFGYEPKEFWAIHEWSLSDVIAKEDRDYILKAVDRLRSPGDKADYEFRLLQKDGTTCWVIGSAEVTVDSDGEQIN